MSTAYNTPQSTPSNSVSLCDPSSDEASSSTLVPPQNRPTKLRKTRIGSGAICHMSPFSANDSKPAKRYLPPQDLRLRPLRLLHHHHLPVLEVLCLQQGWLPSH